MTFKIKRVKIADVAPNHPFAGGAVHFGLRLKPAGGLLSESIEPPPANGVGGNTPTKRVRTSATVAVRWGYARHHLHLTARNWARVKAGKPLRIRGKGYYYEGEFFWDYWHFEGGLNGGLTVWYGDDGGVGWQGLLRSAEVVEMTLGSTAA